MSSRSKKLAFKLILLLMVCSMLEGLSCVAMKVVSGGASSGTAEAPGAVKKKQGNRVVHPFVGYVFQPGSIPKDFTRTRPAPYGKGKCEVNQYGFFSDGEFLDDNISTERVRVLITGGSVANNLYCGFRAELARELGNLPAYQGKKISFAALAFEGWRQPQQLQALTYYLAQGGKADLLLGVDGFNEVANQNPGYPYLPENWRVLVGGTQGKEQLGLVGRIEVYRGWRRDLSGVGWPYTVGLGCAIADRVLEARINDANHKLAGLVNAAPRDGSHDFRLDGPQGGGVQLKQKPQAGAEVWLKSTRAMAQLARAAGIRAHFFIQPSLHLTGSKPLAPAEKTLAAQGAPRYADSSRQGYPVLRTAAVQLRAGGGKVTDLSGVFRGVKEPLYVDSCCHFNPAGNRLLIQAMVKAMAEAPGGE